MLHCWNVTCQDNYFAVIKLCYEIAPIVYTIQLDKSFATGTFKKYSPLSFIIVYLSAGPYSHYVR